MAWVPAAIAAGGEIIGGILGSNSAHQANRTNIKLSREQRAWEEKMANTAVQRRKDDLTQAGFNPVLAATGPGASTPSVSAPTVNPTFDPNFTKGAVSSALLLREQLLNMRANTENTAAQTRGQEIKNNVNNAFAMQVAAINLDLKTIAKQTSEKEYELLEQNIRNAVQQGINLQLQGVGTAQQNRQFERMTDSVVQAAMQQARAGQIDLDALENIAAMGGVEAGKVQNVVKTILDVVEKFTNNRGRR